MVSDPGTAAALVAKYSHPTAPDGRPYRLVVNAHPVYRPAAGPTEEKLP